MKKLRKFIQKNYLIISIFLAVVLVIIASALIINIINKKNRVDIDTEKELLYGYPFDTKEYYDVLVSYQDGKIIDIKDSTKEISDDTILYSDALDKVIFPSKMIAFFYNRNNESYLVPKFSTLTKKNLSNILSINGKDYIRDFFFLYDNLDTYFFNEESLLKYNGKEVNLSKYSYVIVNKNYIIYYNYDLDKFEYVDEVIESAAVYLDNYAIDVLNDVSVKNGNVSILNKNMDSLRVMKED